MQYIFSAATQALLDSGVLVQVVTKTGQVLPIAIDVATGKFYEIAKLVGSTTSQGSLGFLGQLVGGVPLQPLVSATQLISAPIQMFQTHRGFQATYRMLDAIQNSLGILQSTTALIGLGTVAGVALSAVNLHQTLKLREDIKQLRIEVKDGFIDLKQVFKDQGQEIIQRIDQVAQDVEFKHHRTILVQAYGLFTKAIKRFQLALSIQDLNSRNSEINAARDMLFKALADYDNSHLLEGTCSAGYLRRQECVWAIEQAIITTFQVQGEQGTVSDRLQHLQDKIRQDSLTVIERCDSLDELDFIFPEITRIHNHDLAVLESWQAHTDWIQTLSSEEKQQLASSDFSSDEISESNQEPTVVAEPEEQLLYDNLKQKSHYQSLRDQLKFMVKPDLRQGHESYISQQAIATNYKALAPSNWQEIPDLTVANLYWYFKVQKAQAGKSLTTKVAAT
jgi:1,2-phenylacetyl-CoA epoxidase PaaB subunit